MRPEENLDPLDPVTGNTPEVPPDDVNVQDATASPEEIAEPEPEAEKLLRVRLRSGKEYIGKTERELLEQLAADNDRLGTELESRPAQEAEVRGKVRYQQEHVKPEGYDDQHYLDLLGEDTLAARRYQDRYYYGLDENEDPAEAFRFTYRQADKIADTLEVTEFHRSHPDIKLSNDDASLVLRTLDKKELEFTAFNLGAVYNELITQGRLTPQRPAAAGAVYEDIALGGNPAPPVSRGRGGPRAPGGGTREPSPSRDYDNMSLEELKKEARKHNLIQ